MNVNKIRRQVNGFLHPLGYTAIVEDLGQSVMIEPDTRKTGAQRKDFFNGLMLNIWKDGTFEVAEYQAGPKKQLYIYKEAKSLRAALKELIKGNKRTPIKIWD